MKETAHHHPFTCRFDNPTTAVQEKARMGDKAKPLAPRRLTALLSLNFDLFVLAITSQKIDLQSDPLASDIEGRW